MRRGLVKDEEGDAPGCTGPCESGAEGVMRALRLAVMLHIARTSTSDHMEQLGTAFCSLGDTSGCPSPDNKNCNPTSFFHVLGIRAKANECSDVCGRAESCCAAAWVDRGKDGAVGSMDCYHPHGQWDTAGCRARGWARVLQSALQSV